MQTYLKGLVLQNAEPQLIRAAALAALSSLTRDGCRQTQTVIGSMWLFSERELSSASEDIVQAAILDWIRGHFLTTEEAGLIAQGP